MASTDKNQEDASACASASRTNKPQVRHRASVACASCRDRRIRCVVPKGESECTQCKRAGTECVIKNDDERRRPISKAYMSSLSERIVLLERMLSERGVTPPPAVHPPKTRQEARSHTSQNEQPLQPRHQSQHQSPLSQQQLQQQLLRQEQQPGDPIQTQAAETPSPPFLAQLHTALSTDGSPSLDDATPPESADLGQHEAYIIMHDDSKLSDPGLADIVGNSASNPKDMAMPSQSLYGYHIPAQTSTMASSFSNGSYKETSLLRSFRNLDAPQKDTVQRVLSTKGHLSFDQLSGRLRFFGPTANSYVYADAASAIDSREPPEPPEPPEQVRRCERIIRSLAEATHDYLLACFWAFYNDIICVIDRDAFETSRATQNSKFYTSFLHITVLAMGYRFADRSRDDIKKISLGSHESTLQREAKCMLDIELERPGGIPSVQALLLLGDLECGVGRDSTGWMYSGMANRLAFDIGLHLDYHRTTDINETEVHIRQMVMKAAVVIDRYWALFLGRPTSIKSQDVGMDLLTKKSSTTASFSGAAPSSASSSRPLKMSNGEIYECLVELMELAGKIVESRLNDTEESAYLHVISLDRQLQNWYRRLPDHLTWKLANIKIKAAPMSFFLLHQQYHVSMILLHCPWARYGSICSSDSASTNAHSSPRCGPLNSSNQMGPQCIVNDSRTMLSRSVCTQQAIRVARIFWQHRQRFDGRRICATGIQHASTASTALLAALAYQQSSETDRRSYLGYLQILSYALTDMSHIYQPASRMDDLLKAVIDQMRSNVSGPDAMPQSSSQNTSASAHGARPRSFGSYGSDMPGWLGGVASLSGSSSSSNSIDVYSVLPMRRESPDSADALRTFKKRRPTASRRASELARPAPPFFPQAGAAPSSKANASNNGILSSFGGQDSFDLDLLSSSAIDGDGVDDPHDMAGFLLRSMDDYVLVHPKSDSCTLGGSSQQHHHSHSHSHGAFDMPIADWVMGDSASGMPTPSEPATEPAMTPKSGHHTEISHQNASPSSPYARGPGPGPGPGPAARAQEALSDNAKHIADWMDPVIREEHRHVDGDGRPTDVLSPESMTGLVVQTVEKSAGGKGAGEPANTAMSGRDEERNHDLDYFRF